MTDWRTRLKDELEPLLREADPRPLISAYHDMPCAIFHYPPEDEFEARAEISMLRTRLEQAGKSVTVISLAERLGAALEAEGIDTDSLAQAERSAGVDTAVQTVHEVLSSYQPLDALVAQQIPADADPRRSIIFITRAGALFPVYRVSALLEQLRGNVEIATILFYPGLLNGAAGLSFMGVLEPDHNYRPRIF